MSLPTGWELIVILLVLVLLFGASKLPKMARSLGQSARVFKAEARGMKADEEAAKRGEQDSKEDPQQLAPGQASGTTTESSIEEPQRKNAAS